MSEISGKTAIITEAASGTGRRVAIEFAKRSVKALGLVDCSNGVDQVATYINHSGGDGVHAESYIGDVTDLHLKSMAV